MSLSTVDSFLRAVAGCLALALFAPPVHAEDAPAARHIPVSSPERAPRSDAALRLDPKLLEPRAASDADEAHYSPLPTLAYVSLGVGAAGIGTGAIAGLLASTKRSDADKECPGSKCTAGSEGAKDVDLYRGLHVVSTIGFGVGLAGAVGGISILLLSPSRKKDRQSAGLQLFMGPQRAGLKGRF